MASNGTWYYCLKEEDLKKNSKDLLQNYLEIKSWMKALGQTSRFLERSKTLMDYEHEENVYAYIKIKE